jgi:hypothetical protein
MQRNKGLIVLASVVVVGTAAAWFGVGSSDAARAVVPPPAPASELPAALAGNPHGAAEGMPTTCGAHGGPHQTASADTIEVGKVEKARGPLGRSIAEVHAEADHLAGRSVRVRGVVVKVVSGVLGRNFLRVRDGSGEREQKTHELSVTTEASPEAGATVLLEGTVAKDRDFGSGYRYAVIVEGARLVSE